METTRIRLLLRVIQTGNLSNVAEEYGYTVSGLSRAIASLEAETGFPLLKRNKKGCSPTEKCLALLPYMKRILKEVNDYELFASELSSQNKKGLIIGFGYGNFFPSFSQLISNFLTAHPDINMQFVNGSSNALAKQMENKELDLCIINKREGNFNWIPLFMDSLIAWVPENHPCVAEGAYPVERVATDPYIMTFPKEGSNDRLLFASKDIKPNIKFTTTNISVAFSMIQIGQGVSIVNALTASSYTGKAKMLPLIPPQPVEIGFAIPNHELLSSNARKFINYSLKYFNIQPPVKTNVPSSETI